MKRLLILFILPLSLIGQNIEQIFSGKNEIYFSFDYKNKQELDNLSKIISLDHKTNKHTAYAYANKIQFNDFLKRDVTYQIINNNVYYNNISKNNWDYYPTYNQYVDMMYAFADSFPQICKVHSIGTLNSGSGIAPFIDFTRVNWSVIPTASGAWFDVHLNTIASQSAASPFTDDQAITIELISTASFSPVAPQFQKTEQWFLDEANCPGDGYAWFWTEFNKAGQKAKYIKISNKTANNYMINQFIPYSNYITFNLNEDKIDQNNSFDFNYSKKLSLEWKNSFQHDCFNK